MANVFDVAKYILERQGALSTWKLQKLCYYSQAWAIAWTEHELFPEDFQAWENGPVCPELYYSHRGKYMVGSADMKGSSAHLTEDQKETINTVLQHYGSWEPYELREQTHHEKPWLNARGNLPEDAPSNSLISKPSMGEYYGSL